MLAIKKRLKIIFIFFIFFSSISAFSSYDSSKDKELYVKYQKKLLEDCRIYQNKLRQEAKQYLNLCHSNNVKIPKNLTINQVAEIGVFSIRKTTHEYEILNREYGIKKMTTMLVWSDPNRKGAKVFYPKKFLDKDIKNYFLTKEAIYLFSTYFVDSFTLSKTLSLEKTPLTIIALAKNKCSFL